MSTFEQFLTETARKGEAVNTLFEQRLFELVEILHKITDALEADQIPYELIGGLAVFVHVEEVSPEHSSLTRDVDLMMQRGDLDRVIAAAASNGFRFRHTTGVDMLIYGETNSARNAVHLIFSGEKVRPNYIAPTPQIEPQRKHVQGKTVSIIPVADLLVMKLTSFCDKDRVHVRALDAAGLITSEIEGELSSDLLSRLTTVRQTE